MDVQTYNAIRAEWEREKATAQAEVVRLTSQLRELDRAWKKIHGGAETPLKLENDGLLLRDGTLASKVFWAVEAQPEQFESPAIWAAIKDANPGLNDDTSFRANVSNALKRLVAHGKLQIIQAGAGNRPTRYKRTPNVSIDTGGVDDGA